MEVIYNMWSVRDILRSQGESILQTMIPGSRLYRSVFLRCSVDINGTIRIRIGIVHLVVVAISTSCVGVKPRFPPSSGNLS